MSRSIYTNKGDSIKKKKKKKGIFILKGVGE
jgi:hypothetical protein